MALALKYWIFFDGDVQSTAIVVKTFEELTIQIQNLVQRRGMPFEWLIRSY